MTNAELVKKWMLEGKQAVPKNIFDIQDDLVELYAKLVDEEYKEWEREEDYHNSIKETLDLLWVAYGYLIALGLDPDKLFKLLYDNNTEKHRSARENKAGKLVVPKRVKDRLKRKMFQALDNYVKKEELLARKG